MNHDLFQPLPYHVKQERQMHTPRITYWQRVWRHFFSNPMGLLGLFFLLFLFLFAFVGPYFSNTSYFETNLAMKNSPPSRSFWFGTDDLGRDLFARTALGARISLFVGCAAAIIDLCIGVLWGGISALLGGWVDQLMMRIADILYALPYLLVVILLMVVMGSGLFPIIVALTITGWISMARIVRGQLLSLKQSDYILAARSLGASQSRILFSHLLPNSLGPIIVTVTLTIPGAIFTEAFLSFLGLGVQAPIASWGTMASDGLPALRYYPWRLFFPASFITLTILAFNLIGDSLRDALDPKLQGGS